MKIRPTAIERAFELAASGKFQTTNDVRAKLRSEGFSLQPIQGRTLMSQLRALLKESERSKSVAVDTSNLSKDEL